MNLVFLIVLALMIYIIYNSENFLDTCGSNCDRT